MKGLLRIVASVTLLSASLVAVSALNAAAMDMTITVVERATTDVVADIGDEGDSVGDVLTFANELYDQANTSLVGSDNGVCFRTAVGQAWECFWTAMLEDGQITVEGPFLDAGDSVLAVTGGTGSFVGVTGQMKLHARNPDGTEYDFTYTLTK